MSEQYEFLDALTVLGFFLGWMNYKENASQTDIQNIVKQAVTDIQVHLENQDQKINAILEEMHK